MKRYVIVQKVSEEWNPGCLEVVLEGEENGLSYSRVMGWGANNPTGLAALLVLYPNADTFYVDSSRFE